MKKMMFTLIAMLTIAASASAMSYEQAREEALFLTDKMAYELNLSEAQYEAAYEINLDYLMGVTSQYDVYGPYWERRNLDLSYILFSWQWDLFRAATYFFRPLVWDAGYWHFGIYARYPHRDYFYFGRPAFYVSYRGGHSWRMNHGRSYYEGRRDFYRPGNPRHDQHFGMRSGWDRGDYRNNYANGVRGGHHSSTQVTGRGGNGFQIGDGQRQNGFGSNRYGNTDNNRGNVNGNYGGVEQRRGDFGNQSREGNSNYGTRNSNYGGGNSNYGNSNGSFGGSRTTIGGTRSESQVGGGNTRSTISGGNVGGSRIGGSFGEGSRSGGTINRGSVGGGTTRSNVGGNFGGSRSGGSIGGGSRSGGSTRSTGGSVGGGSRSGGGSNSHGSFGGRR
ncbi:MAG: hypothetical protein K5683_00410 [Prevotella sp.]|nr:hypothetical protein [Prevotella sp.]